MVKRLSVIIDGRSGSWARELKGTLGRGGGRGVPVVSVRRGALEVMVCSAHRYELTLFSRRVPKINHMLS